MEKEKLFTSPENIKKPKKNLPDEPAENNLAPFKHNFGEKISAGSFANVYSLAGQENNSTEYLIKAGKTERYPLPIFKFLNINFPREKCSQLLVKMFGPRFKVQPDMEFITNGLAEYLLIKTYFGAEPEKSDRKTAAETQAEDISARSRLINDLTDENAKLYQEVLKITNDKNIIIKITEVLKKNQAYNFLPKEHLIVGHPASLSQKRAKELTDRVKKLPLTYFIAQERIKGEEVCQLLELDDKTLFQHPKMIEKILTFLLLAKKMYNDTGKLVDTRPEEAGKHPLEWFRKTGNIMVDKNTDAIFFTDTRWLWDEKSRLGGGGLNLIKLLGISSINRSIKKFTERLVKAEESANP